MILAVSKPRDGISVQLWPYLNVPALSQVVENIRGLYFQNDLMSAFSVSESGSP